MARSRAERFSALDQRLQSAVKSSSRGASTTVIVGESEPVDLPAAALKTLHEVVHALAAGSDPMLTTTEAADFLGVSRPHVTKLLKTGRLAYHKKGNPHPVPASAVERFKAERDRKLGVLDAMAEAEADLGMR